MPWEMEVGRHGHPDCWPASLACEICCKKAHRILLSPEQGSYTLFLPSRKHLICAGSPALAATLGLLLPGTGLAEAAIAALCAAQPPPGLAPNDALLAALLARGLLAGLADEPVYGALTRALLASPDVLPPAGAPDHAPRGRAAGNEQGVDPDTGLRQSSGPFSDLQRGLRGALVPAAAAALAGAGQYGRAGALAVAHMGLHPALACFNGGLALLERYLAANEAAAARLAEVLGPGSGPAASPQAEPADQRGSAEGVPEGWSCSSGLQEAAAGAARFAPGQLGSYCGLGCVPCAAADVAAGLPRACRAALARLRSDMLG